MVGHCRGLYQWTLRNLDLGKDCAVESDVFEAGGFKWVIVLHRGLQKFNLDSMIQVGLVSCNSEDVTADVEFHLINQHEGTENLRVPGKYRTAPPFHFIFRHNIGLKELLGMKETFPLEADVIIEFDLKHIRVAKPEERQMRFDRRSVFLDVPEHGAVGEWLCGAGSAELPSKPDTKAFAGSLIRYWARRWPDRRYWLCRRDGDETPSIGRCLDEATLLECFRDISGIDDGQSMLTLFKEDKRSHENFEPTDDDTIIVFCKLLEPFRRRLSYLGHYFFRETMSCPQMLTSIADVMAHLPDSDAYQAYLKTGASKLVEITFMMSSLAECGVRSGCVIIVRKASNPAERTSFVKQELLEAHGEITGTSMAPNAQEDTCPSLPFERESEDSLHLDEVHGAEDRSQDRGNDWQLAGEDALISNQSDPLDSGGQEECSLFANTGQGRSKIKEPCCAEDQAVKMTMSTESVGYTTEEPPKLPQEYMEDLKLFAKLYAAAVDNAGGEELSFSFDKTPYQSSEAKTEHAGCCPEERERLKDCPAALAKESCSSVSEESIHASEEDLNADDKTMEATEAALSETPDALHSTVPSSADHSEVASKDPPMATIEKAEAVNLDGIAGTGTLCEPELTVTIEELVAEGDAHLDLKDREGREPRMTNAFPDKGPLYNLHDKHQYRLKVGLLANKIDQQRVHMISNVAVEGENLHQKSQQKSFLLKQTVKASDGHEISAVFCPRSVPAHKFPSIFGWFRCPHSVEDSVTVMLTVHVATFTCGESGRLTAQHSEVKKSLHYVLISEKTRLFPVRFKCFFAKRHPRLC